MLIVHRHIQHSEQNKHCVRSLAHHVARCNVNFGQQLTNMRILHVCWVLKFKYSTYHRSLWLQHRGSQTLQRLERSHGQTLCAPISMPEKEHKVLHGRECCVLLWWKLNCAAVCAAVVWTNDASYSTIDFLALGGPCLYSALCFCNAHVRNNQQSRPLILFVYSCKTRVSVLL